MAKFPAEIRAENLQSTYIDYYGYMNHFGVQR
jgi:hypothetical protein